MEVYYTGYSSITVSLRLQCTLGNLGKHHVLVSMSPATGISHNTKINYVALQRQMLEVQIIKLPSFLLQITCAATRHIWHCS